MLTKTQIETIESVYYIERASFGRLDVALSSDEVAELRRLALLGLEVDRDVQATQDVRGELTWYDTGVG